MKFQQEWDALTATLVVTGRGLPRSSSLERLGLSPSQNSADVWLSQEYSLAESFEGQIQEFISRIAALGENVSHLRSTGYEVRLDIRGTAETGSRLLLAPLCLRQLAALGIPVSLTVVPKQSDGTEDLLDWLPAADGSHRAH